MKVRLFAAAALALTLAGGILALSVAPAFAQTPIIEDPLDDRSKRRLDNMEKVMRELRAIVFQGRETGKPVVVQPAETDALIFSLTTRIDDLEKTLRSVNGQNEVLQRDISQARTDLAAARTRSDTLDQRLAVLEKKAADLEAAAVAAAAPVDPNAPTGTLGTLPAGTAPPPWPAPRPPPRPPTPSPTPAACSTKATAPGPRPASPTM